MNLTPKLASILVLTVWGSALAGSSGPDSDPAVEPASEIVLVSEVEWGPLNPARGDAGPRAGDLWGDRTAPGPSGFLVEFADGFSSPPHIHNVTYRAVTIRGLVHNDDPEAEEMWMPAGSFWTQPAGAVHVTSAKGLPTLAYVEIDNGPYLVRPVEEAFDQGERPLNVDASNVVWLDASDLTWLDRPKAVSSSETPEVALLWRGPEGDPLVGSFLRLPVGFSGTVRGQGATLRVVLIRGQVRHQSSGRAGGPEVLEPGSTFSSAGGTAHRVSCEAEVVCLLYVRAEGGFDLATVSGETNASDDPARGEHE